MKSAPRLPVSVYILRNLVSISGNTFPLFRSQRINLLEKVRHFRKLGIQPTMLQGRRKDKAMASVEPRVIYPPPRVK